MFWNKIAGDYCLARVPGNTKQASPMATNLKALASRCRLSLDRALYCQKNFRPPTYFFHKPSTWRSLYNGLNQLKPQKIIPGSKWMPPIQPHRRQNTTFCQANTSACNLLQLALYALLTKSSNAPEKTFASTHLTNKQPLATGRGAKNNNIQ